MAVSADYQFELGTGSPLLMGPTTVYKIAQIGGLELPPVRNGDIELVGNGVYAAGDTLAGRTISLDFKFVASSASNLISAIGTFLTAWQSTDTDVKLTWRLPGLANRYAYGRPRRVSAPLKYQETARGFMSSAAADFFCQDPRIFLSSDNSVVIF